MGITLREDDQIPFTKLDRFLANRMSPAGAPRDQVVLNHAVRTRHHRGRDRMRRGRLGDPRRAQFEVEVDGARQAHRAEDVREDVCFDARHLRLRTNGRAPRTLGTRVSFGLPVR